MDPIRAGIEIHRTIRNVARLREILTVFAKHGFDEFISRGLTSRIPDFVLPKSKKGIKKDLEENKAHWGEILGRRLRACFEELGPAFVKFGQLLATREDIFDEGFIHEMSFLRDQVKPIPFSKVKGELEKSLGKGVDEIFVSIDEDPVGTASVGVVYRGKLKNGDLIVLKVKRPGIESAIETDFSILNLIAQQAERISEDIKYLGVSRIISDFGASLQKELNFNIEVLNCDRLRNNLRRHDEREIFYLPRIYHELSNRDVIVMEMLEGIPFSSPKIEPHLKEVEENLIYGIKLFLKTFLKDGFFHADLHGGNFFLLENQRIGLIDFGLMGHLGKKSRQNFVAIVYSLISFNYENLIYEFLDVADYDRIPDVDALVYDVRETLSPYVGLTVQQTDFTELFQMVLQTLRKHELYLPRDWYVVFRALMTIDGTGKLMGLDLDVYSMMEEDIHEIITDNISKDEFLEEGVWVAKDLLSSARLIPRHLKWFLKSWSKNGYSFEVKHSGYQEAVNQLSKSVIFFALVLMSSVIFFSGVYMIGDRSISRLDDIPTISLILWAGACFMTAYGFKVLYSKSN